MQNIKPKIKVLESKTNKEGNTIIKKFQLESIEIEKHVVADMADSFGVSVEAFTKAFNRARNNGYSMKDFDSSVFKHLSEKSRVTKLKQKDPLHKALDTCRNAFEEITHKIRNISTEIFSRD